MPLPPRPGKFYPSFTIRTDNLVAGARARVGTLGKAMVALAGVMFVGLFGWGAEYFGWYDPDGKVQLALFTSFLLGAVSGYKSRG